MQWAENQRRLNSNHAGGRWRRNGVLGVRQGMESFNHPALEQDGCNGVGLDVESINFALEVLVLLRIGFSSKVSVYVVRGTHKWAEKGGML